MTAFSLYNARLMHTAPLDQIGQEGDLTVDGFDCVDNSLNKLYAVHGALAVALLDASGNEAA